MQQFPYFSPQILTDSIFLEYGGQTGTSTAAMRQNAYLLAEEQLTEHLSSFLVPTIITGSARFLSHKSMFETEFGNIQRVLLVSAEFIQNLDPLSTRVYTGTTLVRNAEYGLLDVVLPAGYGSLYKTTVVYQSGLASGTVTSPTILGALTLAAQINLNEWDVSLSNEGTADVGIEMFSNQSYSEKRKYLGRTVFGDSAMAQRVARMTKKYRAKPSIGFK